MSMIKDDPNIASAAFATAKRTSRKTLSLDLEVRRGALPRELRGHVFFIGPSGTLNDCKVLGGGDFVDDRQETTIFNGDGMLVRIDFGDGAARLHQRVLMTPDLLMDKSVRGIRGATKGGAGLIFRNHGIMRMSLTLGMRNSVNTALTPLKHSGGGYRLLACWDAGMPWEIDPVSLSARWPLGWSGQPWRDALIAHMVFPGVFTTAHPAVDSQSGEVFMTNWSAGVRRTLFTLPVLKHAGNIAEIVTNLGDHLIATVAEGLPTPLRDRLVADRLAEADPPPVPGRTPLSRKIYGKLGLLHDVPIAFTYLMRMIDDEFEPFRLSDATTGEPVEVTMSTHQLAVTEHHVIVLDSAFQIGFSGLFSNPLPHHRGLQRVIRELTATPIEPKARFWVVDRRDFAESRKGTWGHDATGVPYLPAQKYTLPGGAVHFFADYQEDDGVIRLQVAHNNATDVSQWIHPGDLQADTLEPVDPKVVGFYPAPMDIDRLATYEFDTKTERVTHADQVAETPWTWGVALYAGPGIDTPEAPPSRRRWFFFYSSGFQSQLASAFIMRLYQNSTDRVEHYDTVRRMATGEEVPGGLFLWDSLNCSILGGYQAPDKVLSSPIYVPHPEQEDSEDGPPQGWLLILEMQGESQQQEVLVFKASDFCTRGDAVEPIAVLGSDEFHPGWKMHTAYLPSLETAPDSIGAKHVKVLRDALNNMSGEMRDRMLHQSRDPKHLVDAAWLPDPS